jgi:hypothetical protein
VGIHLLVGGFLMLTTAAAAGAFELILAPRALTEAIDLGQSRVDTLRTRFHASYRLTVSRPPVDYIEVVTPFRRVALAAQARAQRGDRLFGQRDALAVLAETPAQIDLLVELTFHPQNTFIGVPAYEVHLLPAAPPGTPVAPQGVSYAPRFGPRIEGTPLPFPYPMTSPAAPGGQPLAGGTIVVHLDGRAIDSNGLYDVLVLDGGTELGRARLDFRGLR